MEFRRQRRPRRIERRLIPRFGPLCGQRTQPKLLGYILFRFRDDGWGGGGSTGRVSDSGIRIVPCTLIGSNSCRVSPSRTVKVMRVVPSNTACERANFSLAATLAAWLEIASTRLRPPTPPPANREAETPGANSPCGPNISRALASRVAVC